MRINHYQFRTDKAIDYGADRKNDRSHLSNAIRSNYAHTAADDSKIDADLSYGIVTGENI